MSIDDDMFEYLRASYGDEDYERLLKTAEEGFDEAVLAAKSSELPPEVLRQYERSKAALAELREHLLR